MKIINIFLLIFLLVPFSAYSFPLVIGTYEVSYIYNSMITDDDFKITASTDYNGTQSSPILISNLNPGEYRLEIVNGRISGNIVDKNVFESAVDGDIDKYWDDYGLSAKGYDKYESGFDGGNTDPKNDSDKRWLYRSAYWFGNEIESGVGGRFFDLNSFVDINISTGDSIWLYWNDSFTKDNLGGVTVQLSQLSEVNPIPEPGTVALLGIGLAGLGLYGYGRRIRA